VVHRTAARLLAAALAGFPAAALLVLAPPDRLGSAWAAGLHARDGGTSLLLATAGALAWALVAWLTLGLALAALGAAPGAVGAVAQRLGRRLTPAMVRSLLSGGTAVGLALAPALLPGAASAAPAASTGTTVTACASPVASGGFPSLDRPVVACPQPAATPTSRPPSTAHDQPSTQPAPRKPPDTTRSRTAPAPVTAVPVPPNRAGTHAVQAGDTLWSLARAELRTAGLPVTDTAVAHRWPAWWQANRAEIGPDPDLLHPGELLHAPAALTHQETS
jgi:nucleoid-associated protein YgaU